jgi:hypothetical protein
MKSICEIAALFVVFSIATVTPAFAGTTKSVTVTNNTTYTLSQLFASSSDASDWSGAANLLTSGQTLGPGQQATFTISTSGGNDDDSCNYDLMGVLYGATQYAYTYSLNTCSDGGSSWNITGL